ncbi:hypothetical protein TNCV_3609441 [Trichonephila clavipes]|nr:hypothetical protein TNCV_3609441 [Trichonephila clavipes]
MLLLPFDDLGSGPRMSKAIRSKGAPTLYSCSLPLVQAENPGGGQRPPTSLPLPPTSRQDFRLDDYLEYPHAAKAPSKEKDYRQHRHWTVNDWKHVAWSDESRFQLNRADRRVRVWRQPRETIEHYISTGAVQLCDGMGRVQLA